MLLITLSDNIEEEFIKEFAKEKGISIERGKALLEYQLKLAAVRAIAALNRPIHPVREEFNEIIDLCNEYDEDLFKKTKMRKIESYDSSFLFLRDAINKTNIFFSTKFLSSHNYHFSDPFYFNDLSRVFHDLKMTLVELVQILEWQLRKKFDKKQLKDLINQMNLDPKAKNDLHFIRKVRNHIIHRQGISNKMLDYSIDDTRFLVRKGDKIIDETTPISFSYYFLLIRRLIKIYYSWINNYLNLNGFTEENA